VRAWLEQGLDRCTSVQTQEVTLASSGTQTVGFAWPAKEIAPYGQALKVEVLEGGKVLATGGDAFTCADNVWSVGIAGGHPVAFTAVHVKDLAGIEAAVERFRAHHINTFEKFFWAPDDFAMMTPDQPEWFSGQARYHESLERLKHMCGYGRQVGVLPTTYGKSVGSGTAARDFIRANPEMIYGYGGVMSYAPDTEELARWDKDEKPYWQSVAWANYNMNDPAVVQHGITEIEKSTRQFGWAGVRFDGHFRARTGKQRVGDTIVDFTPEMADAQTAANQRALKDQLLKADPRYVFGYNFAECDFRGRLLDFPRESVELCEGGGHVMDEYAKQNVGGAHPFRKWADYAHMLVTSAEQVRRLGGHYFPMVQSTGPVGRYQTLFTFAAGGHPNGMPGDHPYNAFATRYAEFLWGKNVRNVWNPCGLVIVGPGVLWEDYVRIQQQDVNRTRLVIHLINPPAQETATDTQAAFNELGRRDRRHWEIKAAADKAKATPDYSELEKLPPVKLYPDPKSDVAVKLVPRALDDGPWTATRALLLDPETGKQASLAIDRSDAYFIQFRVPEVKFWSVVVIELARREN
jgi:hypothetical protein